MAATETTASAAVIVVASSPLVGPTTTLPTVDALRRLGRLAEQADLRPVVDSEDSADAAARRIERAAGRARPVIVAHSGAGPLVPLAADRLDATAVVLVDAIVPPLTGTTRAADEGFRSFLAEKIDDDGRLPVWSEWFRSDILKRLVADRALRDIVAKELPLVPLAYFDRDLAVPNGWAQRPCAYVRLSALYEAEAAVAIERGWPVTRLDRDHLATATRPDVVAGAITDLLDKLP